MVCSEVLIQGLCAQKRLHVPSQVPGTAPRYPYLHGQWMVVRGFITFGTVPGGQLARHNA